MLAMSIRPPTPCAVVTATGDEALANRYRKCSQTLIKD